MRIVILTQYYPPESGAPQARLSDLARRLRDKGHDVTVLTAMPSYPRGRVFAGYGGVLRHETLDGIPVIRTLIFPTQKLGVLPRLLNYFSFVISSFWAGLLLLGRQDYLLTESPPLFLGLSGYCLSRLKRARWVFNVSDLWPESAVRLGVVREGRLLRLAERLEAFCYRHAWLVTAQSRGILESIERRFPSVPCYHLSNGVDTEMFSPARRSAAARQELGGNGDGAGEPEACLAVYAGLHGLAQGLDQVVKAAAMIDPTSRLRVVMIGDGPEKLGLVRLSRELAVSRLRFLEGRTREEIPELLASADVALVPLRQTLPGAVPSKLYEAMGAGVPVVLIAEGESRDLLLEAGSGVAVSPGDVAGLREALEGLAKDPARRARMGLAGRAAAERSFSRKTIGDRFVIHLEDALPC